MRFNIIFVVIIAFITTSCAQNNLKRSSSNKLFDMSGFEQNKRRPLYNKKYINLAKKNIKEISDSELSNSNSEMNTTEIENIRIYKEMLNSSKSKDKPKLTQKLDDLNIPKDEFDGDLVKSRKRLEDFDKNEKINQELKKEIEEIKKLLDETKKEIKKLKIVNKDLPKPREDLSKVLDEELKSVSKEKKKGKKR